MPTPPRLSVQLYSLRRIPSLEDQLRLVGEAGLAHVEATSANYDEADSMRGLLDRFGLTVPSGHVGLDRLQEDFAGTVAVARRLGIGTLILWGLPEDRRPATADGWRQAGAALGGMATRLAGEGLAFAFHNHDWELERFADGGTGLDHLFAGAAAAPLAWQADLAWLARGGGDIDALLAAHAGRLHSVHLKDIASAATAEPGEDGWADLGHGTLPWPDWWGRLRAAGVDLAVLEHDEPSDPRRFLTRSAATARALLQPA